MKSYYTSFLSSPLYKSAEEAQEYSRTTRALFHRDPTPWVLRVSCPKGERETTLEESRMLLLAPLLYRFPEEFGMVSPLLRKQCRDALYAVLTTRSSAVPAVLSSTASEHVLVFLEGMRRHLQEDRRDLALPLFTQYHDVVAAIQMCPDDPSLPRLRAGLDRYIRLLGLQDDLEEFMEGMAQEKETLVSRVLHQAYLDMLVETLNSKDFTVLLLCLEEIRDLVHEHFPSLTPEQLDDILDPSFIQRQLDHHAQGVENMFDRARVQNYFDRIHQTCNLPPPPTLPPDAEIDVAHYVCRRLQGLYASLGV